MNKSKVQGAMDDAAGRAKRQVGEWTGDTNAQLEGAAQQLKGKVEKVVGSVKDGAQKAENEFREEMKKKPSRFDGGAEEPDAVNRH